MSDRPDILREYRVKIVPADEAGRQPRYPDNLGLRTKFGGTPDAIQGGDDDEPKTCPQCFQPMHFVAQLDSFEFNGENNPNRKDYGDAQFMFGDVGMIYVWFCFNCLTPHATTEVLNSEITNAARQQKSHAQPQSRRGFFFAPLRLCGFA